MISWPSDKVKPGGAFHVRKPTYSKDTQALLKVLMDEAKLTILQRNQINYHLRNGDSLPLVRDKVQSRQRCSTASSHRSSELLRKRSLDLIRSSGAFEQPPVHIGPYREPCELAKRRLQDHMFGVNGMSPEAKKKKPTAPQFEAGSGTQIEELLCEIRERAEWLSDMERLGEGKKYSDMIQNQIAEKLREIKRLEKIQHNTEMENHLGRQLNELTM